MKRRAPDPNACYAQVYAVGCGFWFTHFCLHINTGPNYQRKYNPSVSKVIDNI